MNESKITVCGGPGRPPVSTVSVSTVSEVRR